MEQVGWKLVDGAGNEIASWGGTPGQYPSIPNPIILPSKTVHVHAPEEGVGYADADGEVYTLVRWEQPVAPHVPQTVTMAQAQLALLNAGLLAQIEAGINNLPESMKQTVLIAWQKSPHVSRQGNLVNLLATDFGLTEKQLDELFIAAAKIEL